MRGFLSDLLQAKREIREALAQEASLKMKDEDWKAFHKATECHICKKDLMHYNTKDEIEFWDPETGEYCVKVHKFTRAPRSRSSCYSEVLKLTTQDENGKYNIKEWHPRDPKSKTKEDEDEKDCFYCSEPLLREKFRAAVIDHCHITEKFRATSE